MSLVIATPIAGAEVQAETATVGYLRAVIGILRTVPETTHLMTFGDDTVRARNRLAAQVLREIPQADNVLWIDRDNWPENPNLARDLIASGKDVVGAPYTRKAHPVTWAHLYLPETDLSVPGQGFQEVRGLGFGFTLTSRRALEILSAQARIYTDHPRKDKIPNIFGQLYDRLDPDDASPEAEALLSEDYSFCKRWRDLGNHVWLYWDGGTVCHAGGHAWTARDVRSEGSAAYHGPR